METKYAKLSDEELLSIITENETYIDKLFDDGTLPWAEYVKEVEKTNIWEMYVEKRKRQVPVLRDIDKFELGCRQTYESFKSACKCGCFIDYDGSGYYGTLTQISDIPVSCEAFDKDMERTDFEYVYWFNK